MSLTRKSQGRSEYRIAKPRTPFDGAKARVSPSEAAGYETVLAQKKTPSGGFVQVSRLEKLRKLLLHAGEGLTMSEMSSSLDVSQRSVRRYLIRIEKDYELETLTAPSGTTIWRIRNSDRPRHVALRRAQCYTLLAAKRLFEPMRGSALFDEFESATQALAAVANRPGRGPNAGPVDTDLENRFTYLPAEHTYHTATAENIDVFYTAVSELHPVECTYSPSENHNNNEQRLLLHPYAMVIHQDALLIVAAEFDKQGIGAKVFPLHELQDVSLRSSEHFTLPEGFSLDRYYQGKFGLFTSTQKHKVIVDFDPSVAEQISRQHIHPNQTQSRLRNGGVRLTFHVDELFAVARWVLSYGRQARVVEPDELRDALIEELRKTLDGYGE